MKRLFDIITSLIAMILLAPVFIPVMIILRLTGEGEIFYLQERIGRNSKPFFITKFANGKNVVFLDAHNVLTSQQIFDGAKNNLNLEFIGKGIKRI